MLIISGNLSFLNWLTILPALACFDDRSLAWLFSSRSRGVKAEVAAVQHDPQTSNKLGQLPATQELYLLAGLALFVTSKFQVYRNHDDCCVSGPLVRRCFNISLGLLIAYLSIPVVQNLFSSRQHMNTSFDPLRLVNTYGAFGRFACIFNAVLFLFYLFYLR